MADALISERLSPELLKVAERAQREPEGRFHSLAHLMDVPALARSFHRLRKDAAVGVDGVTKETYGEALDANLADLHERLRSKRYRHRTLRRGRVPKGKGQWRPIGISAFEDCPGRHTRGDGGDLRAKPLYACPDTLARGFPGLLAPNT